jgi:hypothetical protein
VVEELLGCDAGEAPEERSRDHTRQSAAIPWAWLAHSC